MNSPSYRTQTVGRCSPGTLPGLTGSGTHIHLQTRGYPGSARSESFYRIGGVSESLLPSSRYALGVGPRVIGFFSGCAFCSERGAQGMIWINTAEQVRIAFAKDCDGAFLEHEGHLPLARRRDRGGVLRTNEPRISDTTHRPQRWASENRATPVSCTREYALARHVSRPLGGSGSCRYTGSIG